LKITDTTTLTVLQVEHKTKYCTCLLPTGGHN